MTLLAIPALLLAASPAPGLALPLGAATSAPVFPLAGLWSTSSADEADESYQFLAGLAAKGMHEMVVREAEAFLAKYAAHERRIYVHYRLGAALQELGREADALAHLRAVGARDGFEFRAEGLFRLGRCELAAGNAQAAAEAFRAVRGAGRDYLIPAAAYHEGEAHFAGADYRAAEAAYAVVLGDRGEQAREYHEGALWGLVWCAWEQDDWAATRARAAQFLKGWPAGELAHDVRFLAAEAALEEGAAQVALRGYDSVGPGPHAAQALRGKGFALAQLGDARGAAVAFGQLLSEHPQSSLAGECALQRGVQLLLSGEPEAALQALSHPAIRAGQEATYWRARARFDAGDLEGSLALLESAAGSPGSAGTPDGSDELRERMAALRGDVLVRLGRAEEAAQAYSGSESEYSWHARAVAELNAGDWRAAQQTAQGFLARYPDSEYAQAVELVRAEALFGEQRYAQAAPLFERLARSEDPAQRARAVSRLGWCAWSSGEHEQALAAFEQLVGQGADDPAALEALAMLARSARALERDELALRSYEQYLLQAPQGPDAGAMLWGLAELADAQRANEALAQLVQRFPESPRAAAAWLLLAERDALDRRQAYETLVRDYPAAPEANSARYGLAWLASENQQYGPAHEQLSQLLQREQLDPELRLAALELAVWCAAQQGDADRALQGLRTLAAAGVAEQRLVAAALATGDALLERERADLADGLYAELARECESPQARATLGVERGYFALDRGQAGEAEQLAGALPADDPRRAELLFHCGEAFYAAGEFEAALRGYEGAAVQHSPLRAEALYKRGFAQLALERNAAAAQSFGALSAEHASSELAAESRFLCAEAWFRAAEYERASLVLQAFLEDEPRHESRAKALFRSAQCAHELGQPEQAGSAATELVKRFPEFPNRSEAELILGAALAETGDERGALRAYGRVLERERGGLAARARLGLGRLHAGQGRHDDALAEFLKVAVLYEDSPEVAEALYRAGESLQATGDEQRAREQFLEVVREHPGSSWAERAQQRLGQPERL